MRQTNREVSNLPDRWRALVRSTSVAVAIAATVLLAGCGTVLWESGQGMSVYFDNNTGRALELRLKEKPEESNPSLRIEPGTTTLPVAFRGECLETLVITDLDGVVVKDPGPICWHDTVTIP